MEGTVQRASVTSTSLSAFNRSANSSSYAIALLYPVDLNFFLQQFEFRVAGDEFRFLFLGQRRRESVGQAHLESRLKISSNVRQCPRGGMEINRKTGQYFCRLRPRLFAIFLQNRILYLGVVDVGHKDRLVFSTSRNK